MDCLKCRSLDHIFRKQLVLYLEARSTPFYRVSPKLAARQRVDMERAKNDMEEHLFICAEAGQMSHAGMAATLLALRTRARLLGQESRLRSGPVSSSSPSVLPPVSVPVPRRSVPYSGDPPREKAQASQWMQV